MEGNTTPLKTTAYEVTDKLNPKITPGSKAAKACYFSSLLGP